MSDFRRPPSSPTPAGDPDSHTEMSRANAKRLLCGSYIGMVIIAASLNALPVCLTAIGESFQLASKAQLGLIASMMFVGRVPAILSAGPLADRLGLRPLLLIAAVGVIVGLILMGIAPTYFLLLGACVVGGFNGIFDVLLDPLVCQLRPDARASALNLLHAFYPVGAIGTVVLSAALLRWTGTWRVVFPVMGLPAVAYVICVLPCRFPELQRYGQRTSVLRLLGTPLLLVIVLMILIAAVTELGPAQWLPAYMERVFTWPRADSTHILLAFNILMALSRFGGSRILRYVRPPLLLVVAAILCAAYLAVGGMANSAWPAAVALAFLGAAVACMWPSTVAYAADRFPTGGATMFSILVTAGNAGGILGPAMIGSVGDYAGLRWGMGSVACLSLLAAPIVLWRILADRSQSSTPAATTVD